MLWNCHKTDKAMGDAGGFHDIDVIRRLGPSLWECQEILLNCAVMIPPWSTQYIFHI
jgi:hypothetical protein